MAAGVVCDGCPGVAQAAGASFNAARPGLRRARPPSAARVSSACSGLNGDSGGFFLPCDGRDMNTGAPNQTELTLLCQQAPPFRRRLTQ